MEIVKGTQLSKSYGALKVLKGVDISVQKGEIVSIVGASGAGKSTLLHILGTLDRSDGGVLEVGGKLINKLSEKELARFRNRHIGFVFQFHHLLPEFTALENVCIPAYLLGSSVTDAVTKAKDLLLFLGLGERLDHKPTELSGGEQQRVAVARALVNQPDVVLADEPSGNLDSDNSRELHRLFFELRDRFRQTFIIVTHNEDLADMSDRKLVMKDGVMLLH